MEALGGFTIFLSIVLMIFGILQIILFFKMWGMTNDVADIRLLLRRMTTKESTTVSDTSKLNEKGQIVTRKSDGEKMLVQRISNTGSYVCYSPEGEEFYGAYNADEVIIDHD